MTSETAFVVLHFNASLFRGAVRHYIGNRTLVDVGEECGLSASTLSRIQNGKSADMDSFLKLCAAMEWRPEEFIYADDTEDHS